MLTEMAAQGAALGGTDDIVQVDVGDLHDVLDLSS
jgi:hypothetical protein